MVRFDWRDATHTNEICVDVYLLGDPNPLSTLEVDHIYQFAWVVFFLLLFLTVA